MSDPTSAPIIISVEGNIGAGKTTIIDKLEKKMSNNKDVIFLREPVDIWESINDKITGENILQKFYGNPKQYAFSFQVMAYATRLSLIRSAIRDNPKCKVIICERSLDADKNIFAKMLHDDGMIEDIEFQIYQHFYKEYSDEFSLDGIIYIDANADTCNDRIIKRSRNGESTITLDYLEKCKRYHDEWLLSTHANTDVFHIETNTDVTYDSNDKMDKGIEWLNSIETYIYNRTNTFAAYSHKSDNSYDGVINVLENMLTYY
jgi:deoxyadenosine/deoxycytidine kinase